MTLIRFEILMYVFEYMCVRVGQKNIHQIDTFAKTAKYKTPF